MKGYVEQRQWGNFAILDEGENYKAKRLTVCPGRSLSLQYHMHRDEWWTVVAGAAFVTYDKTEMELHENQGIFIRRLHKHRLENRGSSNLIVIEVQFGPYLGEDDIVRLEQ